MSTSFSEKRSVLISAIVVLLIIASVVVFVTDLPLPVRLVVAASNVIAVCVLAVTLYQLPRR